VPVVREFLSGCARLVVIQLWASGGQRRIRSIDPPSIRSLYLLRVLLCVITQTAAQRTSQTGRRQP
jgi:hypothetical protein